MWALTSSERSNRRAELRRSSKRKNRTPKKTAMSNKNRRRFLQHSLIAAGAVSAGQKIFASPAHQTLSVAIIGCGRLGQLYGEVFQALPETELVAIAEWNPARRAVVSRRFGVRQVFRDAEQLLQHRVPDLACIVTPSKYMKDAVIACAKAGVKGIQTDRPFAARLSDADEMIETCSRHGAVLAGGVMERAQWEVEQAGRLWASGEWGRPVGAAVHAFRGEICSGGAAKLLVLQHFSRAEVDEVVAWGTPPEKLADGATDEGLSINAHLHLNSGLECTVFGSQSEAPHRGVEISSEHSLLRWDRHGSPMTRVFHGFYPDKSRREIHPGYAPWPWTKVGKKMEPLLVSLGMEGGGRYTVLAPVTDLIDSVVKGTTPRVTGETQRHALEIAIACKRSAQLGSVPIKLPLEDRSLALFPRRYRWLGGDASGNPQTDKQAAGKKS